MTVTRLADARSARGMTQKALAEALGVSRTSVSAVENGHVEAWPRFRRDAARALAVPEDHLFPKIQPGDLCVGIVWSVRADEGAAERLASLLFGPGGFETEGSL